MELSPRQVSFVKSEMERIQNDESRQPTEKVEAGRIQKEAEDRLTE
jgi:hypothetical protein